MRRTFLALAIGVAVCSLGAGQLRVDVALVNVVATVTDDRGRYVSDLRAEDFILEEDGKRQEIVHFSRANELPVSVGIVLDTSASMERKIQTATRAVDRFIRSIHPEDDIFLMTFDTSARVRQDFTSDRDKLTTALYKTRLGSGTALYEGLIAGLNKIKKGKHSKKAILLISDGVDTTSEQDFETALLATRESEVLVYSLGIAPSGNSRSPMSERVPTRVPIPGQTGPTIPFPIPIPSPGRDRGPINIPLPGPGRRLVEPQGVPQMDSIDMDVLDAFADASGGNSWFITSTSQIQDALDSIADELRNQYTLAYYPGHNLKDGRWHRIEIRTRDSELNVRAKKEYFADDKK